MVGSISWFKPFTGNLPFWIDEQRKVIRYFGIGSLIPVFVGGIYVHLCPEDTRRKVLLATTNLAACLITIRSISVHSGLQMAAFGLSVRTLEFHPMTAMKRYLLPVLPLGLVVMATRAAPDVPRLGIRYVGYSAIVCSILDGIAASANAVPGWYFKYSLLYSTGMILSLAVLSMSEEVGSETGNLTEISKASS
jgi:hypothetical protein